MVAPTVIITGRIRSIPASGRARPAARPFVHLLNEIEQHDHMAHDDANQTATPRMP